MRPSSPAAYRSRAARLASALAIALFAGATATLAPAPAGAQTQAVRVASGLTLPVYVTAPPGDSRLFILERGGRIKILQNGQVLATPFLDATGPVEMGDQFCECGLLGMAFHPNFASNGVFYLYYTGDASANAGLQLESRVSRFFVDPPSGNLASLGSETILFRLSQPAGNHNGGTIQIRDGYLYLGLGDGGASSDTAQDDGQLLGKFLRFDIAQAGVPWNPEVWAKGFRNPFRWSMDRETGDFYIGDVGAASLEEINVQRDDAPSGQNFGWNLMEGTTCNAPSCPATLLRPTYQYSSANAENCAVTGGSVYRGGNPDFQGMYFFSDYCSSRIWTFRWNPSTGEAEDFVDRTSQFTPNTGQIRNVTAIGQDSAGDLYVVDMNQGGSNGEVFKLVVPAPEPGAAALAAASALALAALARRRRARG
jgi:glucose/arabinose dehydrogenase